MIGIDTNILLRYFAQDDPVQTPVAIRLLEHRISEANPAYISLAVVVELVWNLLRQYKASKHEAAEVLRVLLGSRRFVVQNAREIAAATAALDQGFDFADVLILRLAEAAGCQSTLTFDLKASRLPGFERA